MDIRITDYTTGTKPPCARAKPLPAHRHMKHRHDAEPAEPVETCRNLPKPAPMASFQASANRDDATGERRHQKRNSPIHSNNGDTGAIYEKSRFFSDKQKIHHNTLAVFRATL